MSLKDIICKEYSYEEVIPYQLNTISHGKIDFFVPLTYECLDEENIKLCYNVSEMDRIITLSNEGSSAPYIAFEIIEGMKKAMDYYILPSHYLIKEKLTYICRDGRIRVAYVPDVFGAVSPNDPAKIIRQMTFSLLQEIYSTNRMGKLSNDSTVSMPEVVEETMGILSDNTIGMDTCMRKLDKSKEKPFLREELITGDLARKSMKPGRLDLLSKFR